MPQISVPKIQQGREYRAPPELPPPARKEKEERELAVGELKGAGGVAAAGGAARLELAERVARWPELGELRLAAATRAGKSRGGRGAAANLYGSGGRAACGPRARRPRAPGTHAPGLNSL